MPLPWWLWMYDCSCQAKTVIIVDLDLIPLAVDSPQRPPLAERYL
jgi:hypothetical protein